MRGRDSGARSDLSGHLPTFAPAPVVEILESDLHGSWAEPSPKRIAGQLLLGLALAGVAVGLFLTLWVQTFDALAVLVAFTNISLITYTALSVSTPTRVTMDGPLISVRRGREVDDFDLTGPIRRIVELGRHTRPNWRVRLETMDGKVIELGPSQVDPDLMHAAIARYRPPAIPKQRTGD